MSRTPLNLVEQFILDLDQAREPWSVQCEVRVAGRFDEERVATATVAAIARHPLARARLARVRQGGRQYFWVNHVTGPVTAPTTHKQRVATRAHRRNRHKHRPKHSQRRHR